MGRGRGGDKRLDSLSTVLADVNIASDMTLLNTAISQAPFAVLMFRPDKDLTLVWRNDAHGVMSSSVGVDVTGQPMFAAFPPSEDEGGDAARQAIYDAVATMLDTTDPCEIGPYRYDLRDDSGAFHEHHWHIRMWPVVREGKVDAILQVAQDVTQDVLDRQLSETLRRATAATAGVGYFRYDPETDVFVRSGDVDKMFGFDAGEAGQFAAPFFERVHPDDLGGVHAEVSRVFAAPRGEVAGFDYRVLQQDGSESFLRIRAEVAVDPVDRRAKLVGTFIDLTDLETQRRELQRAVEMREALVKEANHRIKNSLAIALAMLRMERQALVRGGDDRTTTAVSAISALEARIGAISNAHGLMQLDGSRTDVSFHALLERLVQQMRVTAGLVEDQFRLSVQGDDRRLNSDQATSLSMILNELLTNALKYGMDKSGNADIEVHSETIDATLSVTIRNAIEIKAPIDAIASTRLGSRLVEQLITEFDAKITSDNDANSFVVRIDIPI